MELIQIFESTVSADTSSHAIHVLVAPQRSFMAGEPPGITGLMQELSLVSVQPVRPSELVAALATLLDPELRKHEGVERLITTLRPADTVDPGAPPAVVPPTPSVPTPGAAAVVTPPPPASETWAFAEQVAFARLIPMEQSPLDLESLASLVTKASAVGIGAYAGFVIAGGTPLLLITVPTGMIIFGAASGVAKALEEGLRDRVLALLRGRRATRRG